MGKVLYKKHKVGNFKKKTFDTFIHSHIHSLIQQILIQLNVYWLLDVFPCRQWYAGQCLNNHELSTQNLGLQHVFPMASYRQPM